MHQRFQQALLETECGCVVGETMRVEGVGLTCVRQPEVQPDGGSLAGSAVQHAHGLFVVDAVLVLEVVDGEPRLVPGSPWIELEAAPHDLDVFGVFVAFEGLLEATLAYVAPRAGDVREDLDLHAITQPFEPALFGPAARLEPAAPQEPMTQTRHNLPQPGCR